MADRWMAEEEERKKNESTRLWPDNTHRMSHQRFRYSLETLFETVIHFPEDHPDVIRAISYTATAVTVGGAVVPVLGATGLAATGVVKGACAVVCQRGECTNSLP